MASLAFLNLCSYDTTAVAKKWINSACITAESRNQYKLTADMYLTPAFFEQCLEAADQPEVAVTILLPFGMLTASIRIALVNRIIQIRNRTRLQKYISLWNSDSQGSDLSAHLLHAICGQQAPSAASQKTTPSG